MCLASLLDRRRPGSRPPPYDPARAVRSSQSTAKQISQAAPNKFLPPTSYRWLCDAFCKVVHLRQQGLSWHGKEPRCLLCLPWYVSRCRWSLHAISRWVTPFSHFDALDYQQRSVSSTSAIRAPSEGNKEPVATKSEEQEGREASGKIRHGGLCRQNLRQECRMRTIQGE
jgi:hypothetical protein